MRERWIGPMSLRASVLMTAISMLSATGEAAPLRIQHQTFRLKNGLTVVLHPDQRRPRVAVNLLYRVGSRDDPTGRTGMAHLFEHLMFMGTRRVPEKQIDLIMERAGGWNNAYTSNDITVYYDVGPSRLLPTLLWLEADRMASLARGITAAKLRLQQDVVVNELRQSYENTPYGRAQKMMPGLVFPKGHPYSWPIIGSVEHVRATRVGDVRKFFGRYYAPNNAALVVAGRFDPAKVRAMVERYFGWIPAGPGGGSQAPRPASSKILPWPHKGELRHTMRDRVKLPRLYFVWHSPSLLQPGDAEMDLLADVLATGKQSRLHRELVFEQQLALDVDAYQESRMEGSTFGIEVTARAGVDPAVLKRAVDRVLAQARAAAPSQQELDRAVSGFEMQFVLRMERLQRRAELLNVYLARTGKADFAQQDLDRYRKVTTGQLHRWCRQVLRPSRRLVLLVVPE